MGNEIVLLGLGAAAAYLLSKRAPAGDNTNPQLPPPPGGNLSTVVFDSFQGADYSLTETGTAGRYSPNGLWYCVYKSAGFAGVQANQFVIQPRDDAFYQALLPGDTKTTSAVNVQLTKKAVNLRTQLTMSTTKQMRSTAAPNPWEVAWLFGKYVDNHHHYYFLIKSNNSFEFGKKDYLTTEGFGEHQIFLKTGTLPADLTWALGRAYAVDFQVHGTQIVIVVNGRTLVSFNDDGSTGKQAQTPMLGGQPGAPGLYCEDARATFDNVIVTPL